ncbi:MAG TPA: UDP-N-acetylglucosamine 1-carboxyvinyltransferase, partial [Chloroflexota bacterium]|nr:UDP-N-acetylglucosamine 1-carboxyvinyltransferase [Chloroflexota bacterium]
IRSNGDLRATEVQSMPHPGFPTDKQAEMGALLTQAHGESVVVERVFDRRFGYAAALQKLGADITVDGTRAVIRGPTVLHGAELTAGNDLRSGAAMILAGLVAREDTTIDGIHFIRRGYQDLAGDLVALGASIDILGSIQPRIPG